MKRLWIVLIAAIAIELSRGYFPPPVEALPSSAGRVDARGADRV